MNSRIPLAWLQLAKEKRRLAAAITGVSFAVILMLVQPAFGEVPGREQKLVLRVHERDLALEMRPLHTSAVQQRVLEAELTLALDVVWLRRAATQGGLFSL